MTIHHSTIQRLAFIKYLYASAVEQSNSPELMAAASILTFHDAIELFMQLSSEQLNAGGNQTSFMQYWELLSPKLKGKELPQKESMRRLNKARVALKHSGTLPSKLDIESFRSSSHAFFEDATKIVFGLDFSSISLIEFVSPEESRNHLKYAKELSEELKYKEATAEIALAFEKMIFEYELGKSRYSYESPFFFGEDLSFLSSFNLRIDENEQLQPLEEFIDKVKDSIASIQSAIKILALGLDYRKYSRFKSNLPTINRVLSGECHVHWSPFGSNAEINQEYVNFCIDFVIESSIKLHEFNYEIQKQS